MRFPRVWSKNIASLSGIPVEPHGVSPSQRGLGSVLMSLFFCSRTPVAWHRGASSRESLFFVQELKWHDTVVRQVEKLSFVQKLQWHDTVVRQVDRDRLTCLWRHHHRCRHRCHSQQASATGRTTRARQPIPGPEAGGSCHNMACQSCRVVLLYIIFDAIRRVVSLHFIACHAMPCRAKPQDTTQRHRLSRPRNTQVRLLLLLHKASCYFIFNSTQFVVSFHSISTHAMPCHVLSYKMSHHAIVQVIPETHGVVTRVAKNKNCSLKVIIASHTAVCRHLPTAVQICVPA